MIRFRTGPLPFLPWGKHSVWCVGYVPWWWPVPLFVKNFNVLGPDLLPTDRQIGWVRRQRAALTYNVHLGWVAYLEDQTEENLKPRCEKCGKEC